MLFFLYSQRTLALLREVARILGEGVGGEGARYLRGKKYYVDINSSKKEVKQLDK